LSKLYLTEVIRRECWDDMLVKGRGLVVSELQCSFLLVNPRSPLDCGHWRADIWRAVYFPLQLIIGWWNTDAQWQWVDISNGIWPYRHLV